MKKIVLILLSGLLLLACKPDKEEVLDKTTFPFMKAGNQWNYLIVTEEGEVEVSYKVVDKTDKNYFKVLLSFIGSEFPALDHFWYADQTTFSIATEWPDNDSKFTMLKKDSKVNDNWEYFVLAPLDPEDDSLFGAIIYKVLATDVTLTAAGKTYTGVYKVRETASSHPNYYADYFISLSSGIVKMEGMGYMRTGEGEDDIVYFPLEWRLKSKNF